MKTFEELCKMTQVEMKAYLTEYMKEKYSNVTTGDGYVYAKGSFPVMLVAHMDTVHKEIVQQILYMDNGNIISSPQGIGGDDRCGIYMILKIIENYNCSVLFVEDEEIGCVGSKKFVKAINDNKVDVCLVNYLIELDRKGKDDAVFYDCDNPEFEDFILKDKDWKLDFGTYTDITELAPALGVAAVNFSCGYYKPHTTQEYVVVSEMEANINKVKNLLERTTDNDWFEFIEAQYSYGKGFLSSSNWHSDYDWYDDAGQYKTYFIFAKEKNKYIEEEICAVSEQEAVGMFLIDHPELRYIDISDIFCDDTI